ncbi:MAG: hypothetical protein FWC35_07080 [Proteobacteria bacterium]|nr:hypothetical protein [Pseudomonadota bacterium]
MRVDDLTRRREAAKKSNTPHKCAVIPEKSGIQESNLAKMENVRFADAKVWKFEV